MNRPASAVNDSQGEGLLLPKPLVRAITDHGVTLEFITTLLSAPGEASVTIKTDGDDDFEFDGYNHAHHGGRLVRLYYAANALPGMFSAGTSEVPAPDLLRKIRGHGDFEEFKAFVASIVPPSAAELDTSGDMTQI